MGTRDRASETMAARRTARRAITAVGSRLDSRIPRFRHALTRGLTVFIFHEVTNAPSLFQEQSDTFVAPDLFSAQIQWIRERFQIVEPAELEQVGGAGRLPANAALVTFDDAWAGVFRTALPILETMDVPSLCFINMATVEGTPDFGAVRFYEQQALSTGRLLVPRVDERSAPRILADIDQRYGTDPDFLKYQGPTATSDDLELACGRAVWFGSHLYHHWDIRMISKGLYEQSLRSNLVALSRYRVTLPMFATPHGYSGRGDNHTLSLPRTLGYKVLFIGTGRQNPTADTYVLDRLALSSEQSSWRDWWHSTHRGRLVGPMIG